MSDEDRDADERDRGEQPRQTLPAWQALVRASNGNRETAPAVAKARGNQSRRHRDLRR